ncbi:MAG: hypothetical protein Q9227_000356 [Pyrenula ochraceoflavens]
MSFDTIPILDLSLAREPSTKQSFLDALKHSLLEVGFLYIKNTGINDELVQNVIQQGKSFFDLPEEKKLEIEMKNASSFLGYSKLGMEITRFQTDWSHPIPGPNDPLYHNLLAPNQWPDPVALPRFREIYEQYLEQMGAISMEFISLVAEAIGLPATAFDAFFDKSQQHKLKIVKYPDMSELGSCKSQGVGPHKDSMLTSYLLQASHHKGLQVQNMDGEWIGVSYDATFESMNVPEDVKKLSSEILEKRGARKDDIEFTFTKGKWSHLGEATLMNRIKSHPDVGERW